MRRQEDSDGVGGGCSIYYLCRHSDLIVLLRYCVAGGVGSSTAVAVDVAVASGIGRRAEDGPTTDDDVRYSTWQGESKQGHKSKCR